MKSAFIVFFSVSGLNFLKCIMDKMPRSKLRVIFHPTERINDLHISYFLSTADGNNNPTGHYFPYTVDSGQLGHLSRNGG